MGRSSASGRKRRILSTQKSLREQESLYREYPDKERVERKYLDRKYLTQKTPMYLLLSLGVVLLLGITFYRSLIGCILLLPLGIPVYIHCCRKGEEKKKRELLLEFKELMGSILIGLRAGYSAENAFKEAYQDMAYLYGEKSGICAEVARINGGIANNIPLEKLLEDFGNRSRTEEIKEFAEVFSIAKRNGGNMAEILEKTIHVIQSRIATESEIDVMISAKRMEIVIMDLVPFVLTGYISLTSPGFFDPLYHSIRGFIIMTGCLGLYLAAFALSQKIMKITV